MALFKVLRGDKSNLPVALNDGWAYFCSDTGDFYIDHQDGSGELTRTQLNADFANGLRYLENDSYVEISAEELHALIERVETELVQADFAQNDPAKPDYIKNRTHWSETTQIPLDIKWDGVMDGRDTISLNGMSVVKVSDLILSDEELKTCTVVTSNGEMMPLTDVAEEDWMHLGESTFVQVVAVARNTTENINPDPSGEPIYAPSTGIYFLYVSEDAYFNRLYSDTATMPGTVFHKLDWGYMPDVIDNGLVPLDIQIVDFYTFWKKLYDDTLSEEEKLELFQEFQKEFEKLASLYCVDATSSVSSPAGVDKVKFYKVSDLILSDEELLKCYIDKFDIQSGSAVKETVAVNDFESIKHFGSSTRFGSSSLDYVVTVREAGDSYTWTYEGVNPSDLSPVSYTDTVVFEETGLYLCSTMDLDMEYPTQRIYSKGNIVDGTCAYTIPEYIDTSIERARTHWTETTEGLLDIRWDGIAGDKCTYSGGSYVKVSDFTDISMEEAKNCFIEITKADGTVVTGQVNSNIVMDPETSSSTEAFIFELFGNSWSAEWVACIKDAPVSIMGDLIKENGLYFYTSSDNYTSRFYSDTLTISETTTHKIEQQFVPNADWSVNDHNADGYIKNRTHYEETVDTMLFIEWDGVIGDRDTVTVPGFGTLVKVSDVVLSDEELKECFFSYGDTQYNLSYAEDSDWIAMNGSTGNIHGFAVARSTTKNTNPDPTGEPVYAPSTGIYFAYNSPESHGSMLASFTVTRPETVVHKIPQKFVHNADWSVNDPEADGYVKNRPFYSEKKILNQEEIIAPYLEYTFEPMADYGGIFGAMVDYSKDMLTEFFANKMSFDVVFDGVEYKNLIPQLVTELGGYIIGNGSIINVFGVSLEDTGEPFMFGLGMQEYDSASAGFLLTDITQSTTHEFCLSTSGAVINGVYTTELFSDFGIYAKLGDQYFKKPSEISNNKFRIVFDDVEYECKVKCDESLEAAFGAKHYIGNASLINPLGFNFENTGETFVMSLDADSFGFMVDPTRSTTHSIKMFELVENIVKIPEEYLPEKTHWTEPAVDITWDGDIGNRYCVAGSNFVKVSDYLPSDEALQTAVLFFTEGSGGEINIKTEGVGKSDKLSTVGNYVDGPFAVIIRESNATLGGLVFEETGIYLISGHTNYRLHIDEVIHKIPEKYLPEVTHWTDPAIDIEWNGIYAGRQCVYGDDNLLYYFVKVSDHIPTNDEMEGAVAIYRNVNNSVVGDEIEINLSLVDAQSNDNISGFGNDVDGSFVFVVYKPMSTLSGFGDKPLIFKETGVYFYQSRDLYDTSHISKLHINEVIHTIPVRYLPDSVPYKEDPEIIVPEITTSGMYQGTKLAGFVAGETYIVTFNGVDYKCTAQRFSITDPSNTAITYYGIAIGNLAAFSGGNTGEPFIIGDAYNYSHSSGSFGIANAMLIAPVNYSTSKDYTVSVRCKPEIHKLSEEYLPEEVARMEEVIEDVTLDIHIDGDVRSYSYFRPDGISNGYIFKISDIVLSAEELRKCTVRTISNGVTKDFTIGQGYINEGTSSISAVDENYTIISVLNSESFFNSQTYTEDDSIEPVITGTGLYTVFNSDASVYVCGIYSDEVIVGQKKTYKLPNANFEQTDPNGSGYIEGLDRTEVVSDILLEHTIAAGKKLEMVYDVSFTFTKGDKYKVTVDNTEYECEVRRYSVGSEYVDYLGNGYVQGIPNALDTGEPFWCYVANDIMDLTMADADGHTIIFRKIDIETKIPWNYMPNMIEETKVPLDILSEDLKAVADSYSGTFFSEELLQSAMSKSYYVDASITGQADPSDNMTLVFIKVSDLTLSDEDMMKCSMDLTSFSNNTGVMLHSKTNFMSSTKFGVDGFEGLVTVVRAAGDYYVDSVGDTITFEETGTYLMYLDSFDAVLCVYRLYSDAAIAPGTLIHTIPDEALSENVQKASVFAADMVDGKIADKYLPEKTHWTDRALSIQWDGNIGDKCSVSIDYLDGKVSWVKVSDLMPTDEVGNTATITFVRTDDGEVSEQEERTLCYQYVTGNVSGFTSIPSEPNEMVIVREPMSNVDGLVFEETGIYLACYNPDDGSVKNYVSELRTEEIIHKIPEKYLPENTHWTDEAIDIKWDGNIDGKYHVAIDFFGVPLSYVKVSSLTPSDEVGNTATIMASSVQGDVSNQEEKTLTQDNSMTNVTGDVSGFTSDQLEFPEVIIVREPMSTAGVGGNEVMTFKESGIYLQHSEYEYEGTHIKYHISELHTNEIVHKISEKYMPDNFGLPAYDPIADEGKILKIMNGAPAWVLISSAEEASF